MIALQLSSLVFEDEHETIPVGHEVLLEIISQTLRKATDFMLKVSLSLLVFLGNFANLLHTSSRLRGHRVN